ncbi:DUF1559 domain-containing protein [uncultured Rubinisphaera sp.]|uniref:DUF1559 domain-containing protein n=1 Tax=uncultured Rubinisphaera sp. TaxID=1678686 RepID=UPI0030D80E89
MKFTINNSRRSGFTLVELLVTLSVIAILVSVLLPATQQVREVARLSVCENHLRSLGIALHNYQESHSVLPAAAISWSRKVDVRDPYQDRRQWSWAAAILPQLGQTHLYEQIDFAPDLRIPANRSVLRQRVTGFYCPAMPTLGYVNMTDRISGDTDAATIDYAAVSSHLPTVLGPGFFRADQSGTGTLAVNQWRSYRDISDGLSQTLLLSETRFDQFHAAIGGRGACLVSSDCSFGFAWGQMASVTTGDGINRQEYQADGTPSWRYQILTPHPGGAQFAFVDGHVSFISEQIEPEILKALTTPAEGEFVSEF